MLRLTLFVLLFSVFAVSNAQANTSDYVILPGDVLQITVWKEEGMDQEIVVLPSGAFTFPLIGTLNAKGKSPAVLKQEILQRLQPLIQEAAVTVTVKAPLGHKASVIGEVKEPGDIVLSSETSISEAISQSGGFTPYADQGEILVVRENANGVKEKIEFSFSRFSKGKNLEDDIDLKPGDVVVVPASGLF